MFRGLRNSSWPHMMQPVRGGSLICALWWPDCLSLLLVRRLFTALVIGLIAIVTFALVGTSLPEGNLLRDAAEGLRSIGSNMADGFGGGYGKLPSG